MRNTQKFHFCLQKNSMRVAKCGDLIFVPKEPNLEHVFQQQIHKRDRDTAGRVVHHISKWTFFIIDIVIRKIVSQI